MSEERSTSRRRQLHAVDWAVQAGAAREVMLGTRWLVRRRRQRRLALTTGALALVFIATIGNWVRSRDAHADVPLASAAIVLEPVREVLPDGSSVELKTGASVVPAYSATFRRIELIRGEAHFQVVKDVSRPFIVVVGGVEVRAVGTSFAVSRGATAVEVVVTTGQVAVIARAESRAADSAVALPAAGKADAGELSAGERTRAPDPLLISAGNRMIVDMASAVPPSGGMPQSLSPAELSQRLAWRIPRLEFTRTPLREAIALVNPYNAVKLSLADPALGEIRISGLLRADNTDTLLRLLEGEHGIRAEQPSPTQILLISRP
jgi:transmembrane sensor